MTNPGFGSRVTNPRFGSEVTVLTRRVLTHAYTVRYVTVLLIPKMGKYPEWWYPERWYLPGMVAINPEWWHPCQLEGDSVHNKSIISGILLYFSHFERFDHIPAVLMGCFSRFGVTKRLKHPFILLKMVNNLRIGSQIRTGMSLLLRDWKAEKSTKITVFHCFAKRVTFREPFLATLLRKVASNPRCDHFFHCFITPLDPPFGHHCFTEFSRFSGMETSGTLPWEPPSRPISQKSAKMRQNG